ncbi:MAG: cytochrome b/b6 domain-containing protein [Cocleimonas sp.]|nr:cytochrome b/b6 domain-containing protein [Cocleimonas sp.]
MDIQQTKIWDIFIRIFHWSLLATFAITYLTEDDFPTIHVYAGYTMMALITMRLIWGFIGSPYARFNSFIVKPYAVIEYIKDVVKFRAKRYLGHNPAGGVMVIALLISLSMTLFFGLLTYGAAEFSGPLAGLTGDISSSMAHLFKEVHEFFANFTLLLVALHVFGVLVASLQHKENLVSSMITGYKRAEQNDKHSY